MVLFAHRPALSARALFFDDDQYLTENNLVQHPSWASAGRFLREVFRPSTVQGYYQPLTMISLMLDYAVAGQVDNLRVFHQTSLTLHVANTVLVIVLLYMLFRRPWVAAMVGLLFGVHPMTVETIPWIAERKTLLAAFFALWCLVVYVRYARRPGWKLYLACLVLYILALMSKPTSTPLPLVMLLMDFWPLGRLSRKAVLEKVPLLAITVLSSAITMISQAHTAHLDIANKRPASGIPLILCHNIIFYLYKMAWPDRLTPFYPFPKPLALFDPMVLAGAIGTCVLIPALLISLRWTRALLTGWLIFFVAIFPTMGVLGFTIVIASDKYAYLPAAGLLFILGWLLERTWSAGTNNRSSVRRVGLVAATLLVACVLIVCTRGQANRWQTTEGLYDYAMALAPRDPSLYNGRGNAFGRMGDSARAIQDYTTAIELNPNYAEVYNNRGNAYAGIGDFGRAIQDFARTIELKPGYAEAYNNRGRAYGLMGDFTRAIQDCSRAIELKPSCGEAYNNRGLARGRMGDFAQAIQDYTTAIELKPNVAQIHNNRGSAYNGMGDFARAIQDYTTAIELKPNYAEAYHKRAIACFLLKEYDHAWADVRMCRRLGGTPSTRLLEDLSKATGRTE